MHHLKLHDKKNDSRLIEVNQTVTNKGAPRPTFLQTVNTPNLQS